MGCPSDTEPQAHLRRAVLRVARPFANRHGVTVAANALRNAALELEGRDA